jgi:hypothetical protein
VGPRAVLDAVVQRKNPSPRQESNPRTPIVQPVDQRHADWAITALELNSSVSRQDKDLKSFEFYNNRELLELLNKI